MAIPGFAEVLGDRLHLPLTSVVVSTAAEDDAGLELGRLTVAAGLAVEERDLRAA